jgi:hypothetical protein
MQYAPLILWRIAASNRIGSRGLLLVFYSSIRNDLGPCRGMCPVRDSLLESAALDPKRLSSLLSWQ